MSWDKVSVLQGKKFRRHTGVYRAVFEQMVACVQAAKTAQRKHPTRGKKAALSIENQVLITVLYWREYRDQEHIALDYGVSQSTISRVIEEVETILIQSGQFSLPGKKVLFSKDSNYEVVIADVTETPTERPQKNKNPITAAKRNDTP